MRIGRVDPAVGAALSGIGGQAARLLPFAKGPDELFAGVLHLAPGGCFGPHEATVPRAILVVRGEAWAQRDRAEKAGLAAGDALYWEGGETLRLGTDTGCIAIVVECRDLENCFT